MTTVVMQPYMFPYIGYFQLVQAADYFVLYDDVNFIKGGWINRNCISINGHSRFFTIPLLGASSNKKINEIDVFRKNKDINKIIKSIKFEYSKAPYFQEVFSWVETIFKEEHSSIASMAGQSVIRTAEYLGLDTKFFYSSEFAPETQNFLRSERLISITKKLNSSHYINSIGGKDLYTKEEFEHAGIKLEFLQSIINEENQCSIIDKLMYNSTEDIRSQLHNYQLQ